MLCLEKLYMRSKIRYIVRLGAKLHENLLSDKDVLRAAECIIRENKSF